MSMSIRIIQTYIHDQNTKAGWWEGVNIPLQQEKDFNLINTALLLIVTEVAEACEEMRNHKEVDYTVNDKPGGIASELTDVIIRTLDLMSALGIDAEDCIKKKVFYNTKRGIKYANDSGKAKLF